MAINCCKRLVGEISLALKSDYDKGLAGLVSVGNATVFDLNASVNEISVPNRMTAAGGNFCSAREVEQIEVALTLTCHDLRNLTRALAGQAYDIATAAVVNEPRVAYAGATVALTHIADTASPIVVTDVAGTTTYAAGTDYIVQPDGSLKIPSTTTIPAPNVVSGIGQPNIHVDYQRAAQSQIEMYIGSGKEFVLLFDGVEKGSGEPVKGVLHRVYLPPASSFKFIDEEFGILEFSGEALPDTSKPVGTTASPLSQYGTLNVLA